MLKQRTAIFKALGHPARLRMTEYLGGGERCVCDLVGVAGLGWSTVSRHLSVLKRAGVVTDERRGPKIFYRLNLPCVSSLLQCLERDDPPNPEGVRCCPSATDTMAGPSGASKVTCCGFP